MSIIVLIATEFDQLCVFRMDYPTLKKIRTVLINHKCFRRLRGTGNTKESLLGEKKNKRAHIKIFQYISCFRGCINKHEGVLAVYR